LVARTHNSSFNMGTTMAAIAKPARIPVISLRSLVVVRNPPYELTPSIPIAVIIRMIATNPAIPGNSFGRLGLWSNPMSASDTTNPM